MADQQELERLVESQRARLAEFEAVGTRTTIGLAIAAALSQSGIPLRQGAAEQLVELLQPAITLQPDGVGGQVATGPSLTPLSYFIKQTLAQPSYAHFVQSDGGAPSPANPAPDVPDVPSVPSVPSVQETLPVESLGARIVREALSQQATATTINPSMDVSQPFGLPRRRTIAPGVLPLRGPRS